MYPSPFRGTGVLAFLFVWLAAGPRPAQAIWPFSGSGTDQSATVIDGSDQAPPVPAEEQPEVLTRGPVHEAFAKPVSLEIQDGTLAPRQPPPGIEEIPPSQRPADAHFAWVPGYWSWDADRDDFIWVSACWRAAPPNTCWVPGYWTQVADGWEWVSGFWASGKACEIEYLQAPPPALEVDPPGPAPADDAIWVPGCWFWTHDRYVHRSGYWLQQRAGWVWVPSHYQWTPRGYVFVEGHWDYSLDRRGVLFAPVYIRPAVYQRPRFLYSPRIVLDVGVLTVSLFTCPRYSHYYFGDYYDDTYLRVGIFPRFQCETTRFWYDPIYVYDRWSHLRLDRDWAAHERAEYDRCRVDRDRRPPRTYHEMEARLIKASPMERARFQGARPLEVVVADKASPMKFEHIGTGTRKRVAKQTSEVRVFREERNRWESTPAARPAVPPGPEHRDAGAAGLPSRSGVTSSPPSEKRTSRPADHPQPPVSAVVPKPPAVPSTTPRETATTPTPSPVPAAPSDDRHGAAKRATDSRGSSTASFRTSVTPAVERRGGGPAIQDSKSPAPKPPEDLRLSVPSAEPRALPPSAGAPRDTAANPSVRNQARDVAVPLVQRQPAFVPPREIPASQPQRVPIPAPPIVAQPGQPSQPVQPASVQTVPPVRPPDERGQGDRFDRRSDESARRHGR